MIQQIHFEYNAYKYNLNVFQFSIGFFVFFATNSSEERNKSGDNKTTIKKKIKIKININAQNKIPQLQTDVSRCVKIIFLLVQHTLYVISSEKSETV